MTEFIINQDIDIPEGTPRDKYAKYGMEHPLFPGEECHLIREGRSIKIPNNMFEQGKVFVFPGDIVYNKTKRTAMIYMIRKEV